MQANTGFAAFMDTAWPYCVAVLVVLAVIVLIALFVVLVRAAKAMKGVNDMVETANAQVTPTLQNVNTMIEGVQPAVEKIAPLMDRVELTVDTVNLELLRVDSILEDVENVTSVAGDAANTVANLTAAPTEAVGMVLDKVRGLIGEKSTDEHAAKKRFIYPIGKGKQSN